MRWIAWTALNPLPTRAPLTLGTLLVLAVFGCNGDAGEDAQGLEAHDPHGGGGSFTVTSHGIELFAVYPHQISGVPSEEPWEIHFTWVDGWQPVGDADVRLLMHGPRGSMEEIAGEPDIPGVYLASPALPTAGEWRAEFVVSVGESEYTISGGYFEVFASEEDAGAHVGHDHSTGEADTHAGHDHAPSDPDAHAGHDHAAGEPASGLITLSKEEQWSFPFAVGVAEERAITPTIPGVGELVAPPGGLVHVSSPVAGLVQVDGPAVGPGDHVRTGQTLALIAPISLDDSYVRTRADVVAAEREADRAERLFAAGAIAERRLEDALRDLDVAVAAFEAIGGRRGEENAADADIYRLQSPINGVIAAREAALGQQMEVGQHAFTIVNAATLWLVARVPARFAAATPRIIGAWFTVEDGDTPYTTSRVLSVGNIIDQGTRTLPVRFSVPNPSGALKVGMLAEGHILIGEPESGVAVPVSAIQDEDGLPVVYVKVTGDTFDRRVVRVGASDGSWTLVASGMELGEEVVTVGAYQVSLASLGVVAPSDGHAH